MDSSQLLSAKTTKSTANSTPISGYAPVNEKCTPTKGLQNPETSHRLHRSIHHTYWSWNPTPENRPCCSTWHAAATSLPAGSPVASSRSSGNDPTAPAARATRLMGLVSSATKNQGAPGIGLQRKPSARLWRRWRTSGRRRRPAPAGPD